MTASQTADSSAATTQALCAISDYERAVVSYVDQAGYPVSFVADFEVDLASGEVELDLSRAGAGPTRYSRQATLTVSHIRPRPGEGYDQRRYVTVRGTLTRDGDRVRLVPEKISGWNEDEVPFFEYCERSVPRARRYLERLSGERGEIVAPRLGIGWKLFLATRVPFSSATVVPVLLGAAIARWQGYSAWWLVIAALFGACAIHLGLNVANDVFDTASGADDANVNPTPFSGGSRVIQYGLFGIRAMTWLSVLLFGVGIATGLVLAALRGVELVWIGVVGIFLAVFYTAPPFRLSYRGLGDLAVALGFGPIVTLGSYFVVAQRFSIEALYGSLPVAILVMLILYVNQIPDRKSDEVAGKRTLAVRLSRPTITVGYDVLAWVALISIPVGVILDLMPWPVLGALAAAPLALSVSKGLRENFYDPYGLMPAMARNVALHALTGCGLIAGYFIAAALGTATGA